MREKRSETSIVNDSSVFDARIEKLVFGGDGLARHDGRVALIPYVLPGELVRAETTGRQKDIIRARPRSVIESNPDRTPARCKHFMRCGGCQYQHAAYPYQVAQKVEVLREVLRRVGKFDWTGDVATVAGPEWGYRNRIQLHFDNGRMGFHAAGSHRLQEITECPVASPRLQQVITTLRLLLGDRRWPWFLRSMELFTNETDIQVNVLDSGDRRLAKSFFDWIASRVPGVGATYLDYPAGGGVFRVSHRSFFQVNRFLLNELVETAVGGESGEHAWDLYAGVGLFSVALRRKFLRVEAVESSRSATADLEHNAAAFGVPVEVRHLSTADFLAARTEAPEFVLADPPRAGLGKEAVAHLARLKPKRMAIVSCDPATLARDLAALLAGGYRIDKLTLVDLFPQTEHIETVTHMELR
jgi:23S rRNA (uracil1939-C5)-methyltransferase